MANEGIQGALDWVGYPTGAGTPVPLPPTVPGLYPFDFVGYGVGVPRPTTRFGHGTGIGGKRLLPMIVAMHEERSLLDSMKAAQSQRRLQQIARGEMFKKRVKAIEERRQRRQIETAIYSIVLSEV